MRKALVTGADGFIGSHLCELLLSEGYEVRAVVAYNFQGSSGWLDSLDLSDAVEIVAGDVRDPYFCETALEGVDLAFHLAARSGFHIPTTLRIATYKRMWLELTIFADQV